MIALFYNPVAATLFYLFWALFAFFATWRRPGKQQVGFVLFLCWAVSWVLWAIVFPIIWRPAVFPILDGVFAFVAYKSYRETGARIIPAVLIILALLAASASTAFAWSNTATGMSHTGMWTEVPWQRIAMYELTLNAIFILQCIVTGGWGLADALGWSGGVRIHPRPMRGHAQHLGSDEVP